MPQNVVPNLPGPTGPKAFVPDNVRALSWIGMSIVASSAMTIAVRQSSLELDPRVVVMLRFGVTAAAMILWLGASTGARGRLQITRPWLHLVRGVAMAISTHLGFFAIARLDLVTATVLFFAAPIFATIFAGFLHGEHPGPRRLMAVGAGFAGVLIVLRPGFATIEPAMMAAVGSAVLFGFALVLSRPVAQADGAFSVLFSTVMLTAVISVPLSVPVWSAPTGSLTWIAVAVLVLMGNVRMIADIQAYRFGEAASLAPVVYLRLVLIGAAAYAIYGEVPDVVALIGATVIIGAALYIARREARLKKQGSTAA